MPSDDSLPDRLGILYDIDAKMSPSNKEAIIKFKTAAEQLGFLVEILRKDDIYRLFEFDALFIRDTTAPDNYTFDFARTAENLGIFTIDDCNSIAVGSNKVEQARLFEAYSVPTPKTFIIDKDNVYEPLVKIPKPYIIKDPFSCFSKGVFICETISGYKKWIDAMLCKYSEVIVQEFVKTEYDWRIGILNNQAVFACKYYMSPGSWKIIKHDRNGNFIDGKSECISLSSVPLNVLDAAIRASCLVGTGFYGVDVKVNAGRAVVIEVNDNPNVDAGSEDELLGETLYKIVMEHFRAQVDIRKRSFALSCCP